MSYNISTWKIRSLDLRIPKSFRFMAWVEALPATDERGYENVGRRWLLARPAYILLDAETQTWKLDLMNQSLSGDIAGDVLLVRDINNWTDDFSGYLYHDILLPLFREHKGNLSAVIVWEGGDTVERVTIKNGNIRTVEIK